MLNCVINWVYLWTGTYFMAMTRKESEGKILWIMEYKERMSDFTASSTIFKKWLNLIWVAFRFGQSLIRLYCPEILSVKLNEYTECKMDCHGKMAVVPTDKVKISTLSKLFKNNVGGLPNATKIQEITFLLNEQ